MRIVALPRCALRYAIALGAFGWLSPMLCGAIVFVGTVWCLVTFKITTGVQIPCIRVGPDYNVDDGVDFMQQDSSDEMEPLVDAI